jgi:hypothetical protein
MFPIRTRLTAALTVAGILLTPLHSVAAGEKKVDLAPKDTRAESQKTFDRNLENANKVSAQQKKDAEREAMRDKSHDNRVKTGPNTSVGVDPQKGTVNVRKTTP